MSQSRFAMALAAAAMLAACGGSDEPSASAALDGRWTGTLPLAQLTGSCSATSSRTESHDVSVQGTAVVLQTTNGRLEGVLVGTDGFDARTFSVGAFAGSELAVSYRNAAGGRADVTFTSSDYTPTTSCTRKWSGVMVR